MKKAAANSENFMSAFAAAFDCDVRQNRKFRLEKEGF